MLWVWLVSGPSLLPTELEQWQLLYRRYWRTRRAECHDAECYQQRQSIKEEKKKYGEAPLLFIWIQILTACLVQPGNFVKWAQCFKMQIRWKENSMSPRGRDLVWETYVVTNRSLASTVESKTVQARGTFTFQYFKEIPCILKLTTHIILFPILISFSLLKIKFCHFVNAV